MRHVGIVEQLTLFGEMGNVVESYLHRSRVVLLLRKFIESSGRGYVAGYTVHVLLRDIVLDISAS